jgi:hypothetical protein
MITGTGDGDLDHRLEGCRGRHKKKRTKQSLLLRTQSSGLCGCQACISLETRRQEWKDWKGGHGSADVSLKNEEEEQAFAIKKAEENFSSASLSSPGRKRFLKRTTAAGFRFPRRP